MSVNKHFISLKCTTQKVNADNAKPSAYYFYVKTKVSVDFQICISVPLMFYAPLPLTNKTMILSKSHSNMILRRNY